jgi:hypothetical protein
LERNQRIGLWRQALLVLTLALVAGAAPVLAAIASQLHPDDGPTPVCLIAEANDPGGDPSVRAEGSPSHQKALAHDALGVGPPALARLQGALCAGPGAGTHRPRSGLARAPPIG